MQMISVPLENGRMMNDMPTTEDCMRCNEPHCPQAKLAHDIALGRMYATRELLSYVKKVDSGQLVEVVRCKDCKHLMFSDFYGECGAGHYGVVRPDHFCSYGERKISLLNKGGTEE